LTHYEKYCRYLKYYLGLVFILDPALCTTSAFWNKRADNRFGYPPQGNQEPLMVKDKGGRPPGELGVSKSVDCDTFPFGALIDLPLVGTGRASSL